MSRIKSYFSRQKSRTIAYRRLQQRGWEEQERQTSSSWLTDTSNDVRCETTVRVSKCCRVHRMTSLMYGSALFTLHCRFCRTHAHLASANRYGCWFGLAVTRYSTLGQVSAWMGDRLWTGKPPRRRTRHPEPRLVSLSHPSASRRHEYPATAGGANMHIAWYTSPYPTEICDNLMSI